MPAMAAATVSKIGHRHDIQAQNIDNGMHHKNIFCADERSKFRRPEASGDTISFGMPTGSAFIAADASTRAFRSAERDDAVNLLFRVQLCASLRTPFNMPSMALPRLPALAQLIDRITGGFRDHLARELRLDAIGFAQNAAVQRQRLAAVRLDPFAQVLRLGAFGVECADDKDCCHKITQCAGPRPLSLRERADAQPYRARG